VADGRGDQRHDQLGERGEGGCGRVGCDTPQHVAEQPGAAINVAIVQSLFLRIFLATTAASLALAVTALLRWSEPAAMAAGGVLYVLGMFVVTVIFNVPLNNALAAADPASHEAASLWARFLTDWTLWNHVRTVSSTAACALFIAAIAARYSPC
jgi:uncharacterized membrane protein